MKDIIPLSSSSEEEDKENGLEEEEEENMMRSSLLAESKRSSSSSITPKPDLFSKVALDRNDGSTSYSQKGVLADHNKAKLCAVEQAEEAKANLDAGFPSFVKSMQPSHVNGKCRLVLPLHFCKAHLPNQIVMMNLVDENQEEYSVKYLPSKNSFTLGWKEFCIAHKLVEGDALFFQLVKPTEFQVALDRNEGSTSRKRALPGQDKARSCAIERAEEVRANLEPEFPSFVKSMRPSQVSGEFRLGLPTHFGNAHLPKHIVMINLIDENQEEYSVKYLPSKVAFSLGWKDFCLANKLVEGDALVFQLIKPTAFQVYIIRAYGMAEIDGVIGLQSPDVRQNQSESGKRTKTNEKTAERGKNTLPIVAFPPGESMSESYSEEVGSEVMEGIRFLEPRVEFKDIKSVEGFTIAVNGLIINSEFSEQARSKYYELCCSQKSFLHENLLDSINCELAVGLISQTINIADAIRASKLTTSRDEFAAWDTSLGAFEQLGMNVGFLRARINKLVSLVHKSDEGVDLKRFREAIAGRDHANEEIRTLKAKLAELEEASKRFENEIETLKMKAGDHGLQFQVEVDAPW